MRTGSASPVPLSPEPSTANAQGLILRFVDAYPAEAEKKTRKLRKAQAGKARATKSRTSPGASEPGADDWVITLRL